MRKLYFLLFAIMLSFSVFGQQINEFEPNPIGADPATVSVELLGTPSASFSGFILGVESDPPSVGTVDSAEAVSGTFDANGLLVVMIPDLENPSFTLVLTDGFTGTAGVTDIDSDDDGIIDDVSTFGTVLDAIGIPDTSGDEATLYGVQLGGEDFSYTGDEPGLVFRDGTTQEWYAINDPAGTDAYDIDANPFPQGNFDSDPTMTTYGSANPSYVPPACGVILGAAVYTCDSTTPGDTSDTVTIEISYTGSDAGITGITANPSSGITISGDDPSIDANGTIMITGYFEGDAWEITLNGGDCEGTMTSGTIPLAFCTPELQLPLYEPFDYTSPGNLGDQDDWENFSGSANEIDINSGSLSYSGLPSSLGNHVMLDGSESSNIDSALDFEAQTTGTVFASFIFRVTDQSLITDLVDGGYFAGLGGGGFQARVWVIPNPDAIGSTFDVGISEDNDPPSFTTPGGSFSVNDQIFVVLSYDLSNGAINAWINPSSGDFGGSAPAATLTADDSDNIAAEINSFFLRQDSAGETPALDFDELRLGTSWNDVTTDVLSTTEFEATTLKLYPNPNSTGVLNIVSSNNEGVKVAIYDVLGKQVVAQEVNNNTVDVSRLNSGLYLVKLSQGDSSVTKKLIIR